MPGTRYPRTMGTLLLILFVLMVVGLGGAVMSVFANSPEGYEDERGFHYGSEPQVRP